MSISFYWQEPWLKMRSQILNKMQALSSMIDVMVFVQFNVLFFFTIIRLYPKEALF